MQSGKRVGWLMFRSVRKELTTKEEKELTAWRSLSPENEQFFRDTTHPDNIRGQIMRIYNSRDKNLQKILEHFPGGPGLSPVKKPGSVKKHGRVYWTLRIAAIFILLLGVRIYFINHNHSKHRHGDPGIYQASILPGGLPAGGLEKYVDDFIRGFKTGSAGIKIEQRENGELVYIAPDEKKAPKNKYRNLYTPASGQFSINLPDGTMVWLNAESSIDYPANFHMDSVRITIKGEAYFETADHPNSVFRIMVNNMIIQTPGANFNVSDYPEDSAISLTLLNGTARVQVEDSTVQLVQRQQALVSHHTLNVSSASDTSEVIAWKNWRTSYHNASVQTIMKAVSRWYDMDIIYNGKIPDKKFNLDLPRDAKLSQLLMILERQGVHFTVGEATITVSE